MCTLVQGVIMNCKLHTIFTHHSTTQTKSLIDVFFSYKGDRLRQMCTLVQGVIMNCKLHTIFTHHSTTQTKSLIDVFFLTKVTGSDRWALSSQEWLWTVSYIRYLHTLQLHRLNHWLMFFFSYKDDRLRQTSTLVPGVIMNCKPHTIFTHLSTTQWLNHWLMFFFFYKGNWLGQMCTLVPRVIMNCKPHMIFTHHSTTQTKSLIDVFFPFYKGDRLGQMSTLVPGMIMNCKLHTMWQSHVEFEHYSIALFQLHYRVLNAAAQNFDQGQSSYVLHQLIRHSCTYAAHMSPALKGSYVLQRFERGNAVKICNDIMFDFYTELTHKIFIHLSTTQWLNYWLMFVFFSQGNRLRQMSTLVPGVIMNCKLHTIFIHLSTTYTHEYLTQSHSMYEPDP